MTTILATIFFIFGYYFWSRGWSLYTGLYQNMECNVLIKIHTWIFIPLQDGVDEVVTACVRATGGHNVYDVEDQVDCSLN